LYFEGEEVEEQTKPKNELTLKFCVRYSCNGSPFGSLWLSKVISGR